MTPSPHTTTRCPQCGTPNRITTEQLGQTVVCTQCQKEFTAEENRPNQPLTPSKDHGQTDAPSPQATTHRPAPSTSNDNHHIQREASIYTPTSNLAIASIYCGIAGLFTFCFFLLSVFAIVFGLLALRPIRTGRVRGRGQAIAGIVIGSFGSLLGVATWIAAAILIRQLAPIPGDKVADTDRQTLRGLGVLQDEEEIVLLYRSALLTLRGPINYSLKDSCIVMTEDRLVTYDRFNGMQEIRFSEVEYFHFKPAESWISMAKFIVASAHDMPLCFKIGNYNHGDLRFYDVLRRKIYDAREAAGKPRPTVDIPPDTN